TPHPPTRVYLTGSGVRDGAKQIEPAHFIAGPAGVTSNRAEAVAPTDHDRAEGHEVLVDRIGIKERAVEVGPAFEQENLRSHFVAHMAQHCWYRVVGGKRDDGTP